jgi:regulatory protein
MNRHRKQYSFEEVLGKLMRYCAYQERSPKEVKEKALKLGSSAKEQDELIRKLEADRFLDEERFAEIYVKGKAMLKRWGKFKLIQGLRLKGISTSIIDKVVADISAEDFQENLLYLIERRLPIDNEDKNEVAKLYRYLLGKGYESEMIIKALKKQDLM